MKKVNMVEMTEIVGGGDYGGHPFKYPENPPKNFSRNTINGKIIYLKGKEFFWH